MENPSCRISSTGCAQLIRCFLSPYWKEELKPEAEDEDWGPVRSVVRLGIKCCTFAVPGHTLSFMSQGPSHLQKRSTHLLVLNTWHYVFMVGGWKLFLHKKYYWVFNWAFILLRRTARMVLFPWGTWLLLMMSGWLEERPALASPTLGFRPCYLQLSTFGKWISWASGFFIF